jgi:hypothetical protein
MYRNVLIRLTGSPAAHLQRVPHEVSATRALAITLKVPRSADNPPSRFCWDSVLLMEDTFDLTAVAGEAALVFEHMEGGTRFGASVFWTRRSAALGGQQAIVEYWQVRREGGQRGIVEVVPEKT